MKNIIRDHALWLASVLILLFAPTPAEAQKALVYCPSVDQSGCTTVKSALTSAFPGGVDIGDDGANGTVDLRTADLFQYAVFFVPSLAETDSAAPYARLREQVVADRLKSALLGRRAFWSGTPDQGALASTRPQKDELIQNLAAWASADFGTVNAPGLVVLQDNSDVVTQRYSWVQPIVGFQIIADPKLASYSSVRSLTAAGNTILAANGSTLAYANMASFGFQTPSGASGVSLDAVGQTGTSVGGQVVLLTQMGANTGGAVIQTDTDDYPPGTPVIMTGTGFQAGETVTLTLHEDPLVHADRVHTATADANGGFVYSGFSPEEHDIDVRFILTAKGQTSGRQAQTTFTDGQPTAVTLAAPTSVTVAPGNSATYTANVTMGGNSNACTVTMEVLPGLPVGTTATFNNNPVVLPNGSGSNNFSRTLTITTNNSGAPATRTPAGTYPFTVRATRGAGCQTGGSDPTAAGTLVVSGPVATSLVQAAPSPASVSFGSAGPVSLSATLTRTTGGAAVSGASVGFTVDGSSVGSATTNASGVATLSYNPSTLNAGSHTVVASAAQQDIAGTTYLTSTSGNQTLTVSQASQSIAFGSISDKTFGDADFLVTATATSGLPVSFVATGNCTLTNNTVSLTGAGSCTVTASQAGNLNYLAAPAVQQSFLIGKATVILTLTGLTTTYDGLPKPVTVTTTPSGVTGVSVTYNGASTAPTNAGSYAVIASLTNTNYTATNATGTLVIARATPAFTNLSAPAVTYKASTATISGTLKAGTNAATGSVSVTVAGPGGALNTSAAIDATTGNFSATIDPSALPASLTGYDIALSTVQSQNFEAATDNSLKLVVNKGTQSITFGALGGKTFGDAPFTVSATATSNLAVTFSASGGACSVSGNTVTLTGAGSCTITAQQAGDGNYEAAPSVPQSFTVAKAKATITVNGVTVTYDGAPHGATGSATGVGGVDLSSSLDLGAKFTNVPGGTANWSFAGDANYESASGTAVITINKANATITVDGYTGVFDGDAHGATGSAKGIGGVTLTGLNLGASFTNVPGGTATWTFTDATGNYNDATGTAAIVISKADATINVSGYTGVYDGNAHGATGSATGVGAASLTGLSFGASFTNVPGGTANWTFTDATGNYNNASGSVAITITKANATVNVSGYTGVFDGAAHGATGTATGVKNESLTGLDLGASFTNVPGGTANWTFTDATGNYNNTSGAAAIVISKADATISVNGYTGVYDGNAHGATGSATGVGGAVLSGLDLGSSFTNVPGGTATWTFTDATGNYKDASGTTAIVITKANPTVNVTGYTGVYDGAAHGATGTATGVKSEALAGLNLGASFTNVPGGTASWTFTDATGNYNDASGTAAIVISKADAAITVNGYTGVYDGNPHGATGSAKGVLGENLNGLSLGASFTDVPGGTASWSYTDATGNYNDASGTAAITISKADPTVAVDGYTGTYDGDAHGASGTAKGVKGETLAGLNLGATFTNVPGGTANWSYTDVTGNYNNASGTAAIVITKANATVNVSGYTGVYDAGAHSATGTAAGVKGESLSGLNLGASFTDVPGGTATWTFTDITGNYNNATGSAAVVITQATPAVTAVGGSFTYDNTARPGSGSAKGVGAVDLGAVTLSYTKGGSPFAGPPINAGSYEVTAHYAGSTNYTAGTSAPAAIEIAKADATISVDGYTGVYDGNAHGATGSVTGVGGVGLSGLNLGASFTNVPGGTASWTFTDATGNYNNASGSVAITITKANATVNVSGYTGVYDGAAHGATGDAKGVKNEALAGLSLGASFTDVPGGTANWTFTDVTGNYNNTGGTAPIVITQATPVVTAIGGNFTFNGSPKAGSGSATGIGGVNLTPAVTLSYAGTSPTVYGPSSAAPSNAGTYTVTANYAGSTNYKPGSSTPVALTINKATIAAPVLSDLVKGYNGSALKPTVTIAPAGVQVTLAFSQDGTPKGTSAGVIPVGVYNVVATITDPNYTGPTSDALFVIYDPSAGFVTGGGWIDSPPNSYTADMSLTGKANFGFVSKYQKGATVPTGNTEFQFKEGNLNFKSTNFQWLVIQGSSQAQFKGTGTINGAGNYNFMVTVVDGDAVSGTKKPDTFRIKITQGTDVVYDNKMNTPETSFDGTVIGGGSIQIQTK